MLMLPLYYHLKIRKTYYGHLIVMSNTIPTLLHIIKKHFTKTIIENFLTCLLVSLNKAFFYAR